MNNLEKNNASIDWPDELSSSHLRKLFSNRELPIRLKEGACDASCVKHVSNVGAGWKHTFAVGIYINRFSNLRNTWNCFFAANDDLNCSGPIRLWKILRQASQKSCTNLNGVKPKELV